MSSLSRMEISLQLVPKRLSWTRVYSSSNSTNLIRRETRWTVLGQRRQNGSKMIVWTRVTKGSINDSNLPTSSILYISDSIVQPILPITGNDTLSIVLQSPYSLLLHASHSQSNGLSQFHCISISINWECEPVERWWYQYKFGFYNRKSNMKANDKK